MGVQIVILLEALIIGFVSASISSVCDTGFQEGPGEHCYYFSSYTTLWSSARSGCQDVENGDLAIINSEEELQFLVNQTNTLDNTDDGFWWIGYYDVSVEGMWKWVDCSVSSDYQNSLWLPGHPKEDMFDCGALNQNGSLIDYQCDKSLHFICEIIPKEFTRDDTNVQNVTGEVLSPTAVQIMWDVSPYSCDIVGYRIHYTDKNSQDDESFSVFGGEVDAANITQLTPGTIYNFTVAALHIDQELARVGPIQLQTEPGDCGPSTLTSDTGNFTSPRYPFDYYEDADCVWTIQVASGKRIVLWFLFVELSEGDNIYFGDGLHIENGTFLMLNASSIESDFGYSSEIRSDSNTMWIRFTSDSTSNGGGFVISYTTEIDCPQEYIVGPNGTCYYFGTELGGNIWSYSRTTCQSVTDGDLVIIDDEEELMFLLKESQKRSANASWWIGYYDVSVEGIWQWVDCKNSSQFQQDLWAPGEPDNPLDDCGALSFDGTVFEFQCDVRLNYICEVTAREFSQEDTNVKNVSASVVSSSRLEVTWIPSEYNCDVLGYRVYYYPEFNISDSLSSGFQFLFTLPSTLNNQDTINLLAHNPFNRTVIFTVLLPQISYNKTIISTAANIEVELPQSALSTDSDYQNGTVLVNSSVPITVQLVIYQATSSDAFTALPLHALGKEHLIATYDPGEWEFSDGIVLQSEVTVTATDDNTRVVFDLTAPVIFQNKMVSGKQFEVYLNKWESVQLQSAGDLTASRVLASSNVAVLSGTSCAFVPNGTLACDYLVEQMPPTTSLGKSFIVAPFFRRQSGYILRIIPNVHDTHVNVSGMIYSILKGTFKDFDMSSEDFLFVRSNRPILVVQYMKGYESDNTGDPGMVIVQPTEQYADIAQITAPLKANMDHFVTIASKCKSINFIAFDGELLDSTWIVTQVLLSDDYCVARNSIMPGYHLVSSSDIMDTTFYVQVYGLRPGVSYVFSAGFTLNQLTSNGGLFLENSCPPADGKTLEDELAVNVYGGDATDVILTSLQDDTVYIVSVSALTIKEELGRVGNIVVKTSKAPDCPDGYIVGPNDHCYRFSLSENIWDSSRGSCQRAVDGDYVIINDQEELAYLVSEINDRNENYTWWIGLYDVSVESQWSWIDCSSLNTFQQSLWGSQEPSGDYDCGVLRSDGTVAVQQCDMRANHGYICEINAKEYTVADTNVQRVHVVTVNESSIHVTWEISNFTCDVLGYRVHFTDISDGLESESISVFPGNASEAILNNLLPYTNHSVAVAALHIDQELSQVGPVFAATHQGTECNVMNRPPSTTVMSPSYPAPFSQIECQQYISVPEADGIQLTFHDFETGGDGSELIIGSGLSVDVSTVIFTFSGSMTSNDTTAPNGTKITVFENKLWLYFIGKENLSGEKGFNLSYSAYILSCPTGYIAGPQDHCYKFSTYGEWWLTGRQYDCQATRDGELAIINDEVELEWIVQTAMITNPDVSLWWIGYYDASVEDYWQWVDCKNSTSQQLSFWGDGQPGAGSYDCGALQINSSSIIDMQCDTYQHFICEIVKKDYTRADTNVVEVTAEALSSSSIRVAWTPSSYTCDILGYTIRYDHEYNNETISELQIVNGGNVQSSVLQSLIEDTLYIVSVAAMHIEQELGQVGFIEVSTLSGSTQETVTTGRHTRAATTSKQETITTSRHTKATTSKQVSNTPKWPSQTTISSVETTPVYPVDNIENGGVDLKLSIAYFKFNATEEEAFRSSIATSTNLYCQQETDVCMGPPKVVSERDINIFEMSDGSTSRRKRRVIGQATTDDSTSVSFFITQAYSSELLMFSEDVQNMLTAYETNIEEDLGYNFELEIDSTTQTSTSLTTKSMRTKLTEPVTPVVPGTKEPPPVLEPWAIALICVAGICVVILIVMCFLRARKKKNVEFDGGFELTGGTREAASQARYNDIVAETNRGFVGDK